MIVAQVARLTDATRVQFPICVLADLSHLDSAFRVIAILAHATRVILLVCVLTLRDLLSMLHWLGLKLTRSFPSAIRCLLFFCLRQNLIVFGRQVGCWRDAH